MIIRMINEIAEDVDKCLNNFQENTSKEVSQIRKTKKDERSQ
jgi:hypothetical protein